MQRPALVQIKVTERERQRWHEAAEREDRTLSEVIRDVMRTWIQSVTEEQSGQA